MGKYHDEYIEIDQDDLVKSVSNKRSTRHSSMSRVERYAHTRMINKWSLPLQTIVLLFLIFIVATMSYLMLYSNKLKHEQLYQEEQAEIRSTQYYEQIRR